MALPDVQSKEELADLWTWGEGEGEGVVEWTHEGGANLMVDDGLGHLSPWLGRPSDEQVDNDCK